MSDVMSHQDSLMTSGKGPQKMKLTLDYFKVPDYKMTKEMKK